MRSVMPRCSSFRTLKLCLTLVLSSAVAAQEPATVDDEIRPHDVLQLTNGNTLIGIVETPDVEAANSIEFRTLRGAVVVVPKEKIASLVPRQSAEEIYDRKRRRLLGVREEVPRAKAELELGLWCRNPLPNLDGAAPAADKAIGHLYNAVRLSPSLTAAYPHLLAALAERPLETVDEKGIEEEVELRLLAREGGFESSEFDYRLGMVFSTSPENHEEAVRLLELVWASDYDNAGHRAQTRDVLRRLYEAVGTPSKIEGLYRSSIVEPQEDPANFVPFFELGKLKFAEGTTAALAAAKEYFLKAQAVQPEFHEILGHLAAIEYAGGKYPEAIKLLDEFLKKDPGNLHAAVDKALVQVRLGLLPPAETVFRQVLAQASGVHRHGALLGLGNLSERKQDTAAAIRFYREAVSVKPDSIDARLLLGFALARSGAAAEADDIAEELLRQYPESVRVFSACAWLKGEAAVARGDLEAAHTQLLRALEAGEPSDVQIERTGLVLIKRQRLDAGYAMLAPLWVDSEDRLLTLNALAYYFYEQGEYTKAQELFTKVGTYAKAAGETELLKYSEYGREHIDDLARLERWNADLQIADNVDLRGWEEIEHYGISIEHRDNGIFFGGAQQGTPDGATIALLERPVDARSFERLRMTARLLSGEARVALRIETTTNSGASTGIVFYRDLDGTMRYQTKTSRIEWTVGAVTTETDPTKGKPVYTGKVRWEDASKPLMMEIRRSKARKGRRRSRVLFDLLLDGQFVARNISVSGLSSKQFRVGVSGQPAGLGTEYSMEVKAFSVYRARPQSVRRSRP